MRYLWVLLLTGCATMDADKLSVMSDSSLCDYQHDTSQELRKPRNKRLWTPDSQLIDQLKAASAEIDARELDCSRYAVSDGFDCTSRTDPITGRTRTTCD